MNRPLLSLLAGAVLLAGCNLTPHYEQPDLARPAAFEHAQGAADWPAADWWRGFSSPELEALIVRAQANNLDLATAMSRVRQADLQARIAGTALLPSLSGGLGGSRAQASDNNGGGNSTRYSASLSASYEVDVWGRNRSSVQASELDALASAFDRDTVALTVTGAVASSYFKVLELRERLRIAEENLANATRILAVVEARVRLGAGTELDLVQQRTLVEQRRAAIPSLRQQRQTAENALALLLGEAPQGFAAQLLGDSLAALTLPDPIAGGLPSELLLRRPDLRRAETGLLAANADIGAARAALFPSLSLSASGGYDAGLFASLFNSGNLAHSVSASLLQPIFDGGALRNQVRLSEERYRELADGYRLSVLIAFQEVEDALIALREGQAQRDSQARVLVNAERAFRLAEAQYRAGAADVLTVLNAQESFFSARDALLQNTSGQLQNQVQLYKVLGGGFGEEA
ncbi:efflux transporter outer membrane subunit [Stutzerimonas azotifigens]|uniref:efflux transporter outer membrane subunit n=1 Tax=Stutzerimonas azotifigens TaxID=291995 RepID=UPI000405FC26|nr:efflux transporter outer membrane subunit [Stutzerimonas azotifigens]